MRFAVLGRTAMLLNAARACIDAGHELALVGTASPSPEYGAGESDYEQLARDVGAQFFRASETEPGEIESLARSASAGVAISMNWPTLLQREIRSAFAHGVVNAHPGDLPRYRGNACPNWAILAGEREVVLTLHEMDDGLDTGPVYLKRAFALTDTTYVGDVYDFLADAVPASFVELVDGLATGALQPTPQPDDPQAALRCFPRLPRDSEVEWHDDATLVARLVRASAEPFAGAYTHLGTDRVVIWRARAEPLPTPALGTPGQVTFRDPSGPVGVLCGTGQLVLEELEDSEGRRGRAAEIVTSARARFGLDVAATLADLRRRVQTLEPGS